MELGMKGPRMTHEQRAKLMIDALKVWGFIDRDEHDEVMYQIVEGTLKGVEAQTKQELEKERPVKCS